MRTLFEELDPQGRDAAFAAAERRLRDEGRFDEWFDLRMLKAKLDHGLPGDHPATLSDVPQELRGEIETVYREAAREAGTALLESGDIAAAWSYFSAIREPGPVRAALEEIPLEGEFDERRQELAEIALFQAANPKRGVQMWLAGPGICNTVTALDQLFPQLSSEDRAECAEVVVGELHRQLLASVQREAAERSPMTRPPATLPGVLDAYPTLLENAAYHTDVSHLAAAVRFSRALPADADAIGLALELCDYGRRLDRSLQYGSEPPFEDLYEATCHYLQAVRGAAGEERAKGLDYFRGRLAADPDESDQPLLAYVLTDLLMRVGEADEAIDVAEKHLATAGPQTGFSFAELCRRSGRLDRLAAFGRENGDLLSYLNGRFGESNGDATSRSEGGQS